MSNVNEVRLIGNVGNAIEVKTLESGSRIGNFSLAVTNNFSTAKGEPQSETYWFRVVLYGKVLEAVESMVKKGSRVMVIGELRQREYLNKDQIKVSTVEVSASIVYTFESKN
jgi:single-strand DNA-binding protein